MKHDVPLERAAALHFTFPSYGSPVLPTPPTPFFLPPFTYHSLPLPLSSEREGGEKRVISKWGEKEGGSVEGVAGAFLEGKSKRERGVFIP